MNNLFRCIPYVLVLISFFHACSDRFSDTVFRGSYPHQRYLRQLHNAGLEQHTLYRQWSTAAQQSLTDPSAISIPHQESAYIAADKPTAIGYAFAARQGEQLQVDVTIQSTDSPLMFIDLFEVAQDTSADPRHLISMDTGTTALTWDIRRDAQYLLRIQPELLAELSFSLRITAEPSLANPVAPDAKQHIGSVFGDTRDGGARKHEGIDIFAERQTPVVAAADGIVGRVSENRLGGKVVWLRPKGRQINLYYAHLDSQLVVSGRAVKTGDTLGLMGNTGNARTTPPHLHFGIYATGGAVDPLPFLRPGKSTPPKIAANTDRIGDTMRTTTPTGQIPRHVPVRVEAASTNGYRVVFPNNSRQFLSQKQVVPLSPLRPMKLAGRRILYAQPNTSAAQITEMKEGELIQVLATFHDFLFIEGPLRGWILH